MKRLLLSLGVVFLCGSATHAGDIMDVFRVPVQMADPYVPFVRVSNAVPTSRELLAIPAPQPQNLIGYPQDVLRYGFSVHPGARVARQNGWLPFEF